MEYRKNHTVASFQIKFWSVEHKGRKGVHFYDLRTGVTDFCAIKRREKPFPFAIANDLYTWDRGLERDPRLEKWFSGIETELSRLIGRMERRDPRFLTVPLPHDADGNPLSFEAMVDLLLVGRSNGTGPVRNDLQTTPPASMVLASQEVRSRYNLSRTLRELRNNPELLALASAHPDQTPEEVVRTQIPQYAAEIGMQFRQMNLTVFHADRGAFYLTDRPTVIDPITHERTAVMTSRIALRYEPSRRTSVQHRNATGDEVESINTSLLLGAREWVVSTDNQRLARVAPIFESPAWQEVVAADTLVVVEPDFFRRGYRY